MRRSSEWLIAIHESGHAIAALHLDRSFKFASIVGEENSLGRVVRHRPSWFWSDTPRNHATYGRARRACLERLRSPRNRLVRGRIVVFDPFNFKNREAQLRPHPMAPVEQEARI